jgi:hypothetical protein
MIFERAVPQHFDHCEALCGHPANLFPKLHLEIPLLLNPSRRLSLCAAQRQAVAIVLGESPMVFATRQRYICHGIAWLKCP